MEQYINKIINADCMDILKQLPDKCIDLVVTSPPYDNLRTYNGTLEWSFEIFQDIAKELTRVLKDGGVIVWIVADATINGSETGTSFKQALYFKELGLNIHDTMIWNKNAIPYDPKCNRYWQAFEYMFVFSKGKPICNYLTEPCKNAGLSKTNDYGQRRTNGSLRNDRCNKERKIKDTKIKTNVWYFSADHSNNGHVAVFPEQLAYDHIISWSNENDIILDPFVGSGTTCKVAYDLKRRYVGIEKVKEYYDIACERLENAQAQLRLF